MKRKRFRKCDPEKKNQHKSLFNVLHGGLLLMTVFFHPPITDRRTGHDSIAAIHVTWHIGYGRQVLRRRRCRHKVSDENQSRIRATETAGWGETEVWRRSLTERQTARKVVGGASQHRVVIDIKPSRLQNYQTGIMLSAGRDRKKPRDYLNPVGFDRLSRHKLGFFFRWNHLAENAVQHCKWHRLEPSRLEM